MAGQDKQSFYRRNIFWAGAVIVAMVVYVSVYFTLTRTVSPSMEVKTNLGWKTAFLLLPKRVWQEEHNGQNILFQRDSWLEEPCYYLFYPMLLLDALWADRIYWNWTSYDEATGNLRVG